jgi:hypothetical protein
MTESDTLAAIQLALSNADTRLLRVNAGNAWAGTIVERSARRLVLLDYRPVRLAHKGVSDLLGWHTVEISEDMVGAKFARFLAPEVKSLTGRLRPEQKDFIALVNDAGGVAGLVRSVEDVRELLLRAESR